MGVFTLYLDKENLFFVVPDSVIFKLRMSKLLAALLCGIALPISGFLLQEVFKNPLAGPSVLGISTSASVGVALCVFLGNKFFIYTFFNDYALVVSALFGSFICLFLLLWLNNKLQDNNTFIIIGFLISALGGTLVSFLEFVSPSELIKQYIVWNLGSFTALSWHKILIYTIFVFIGIIFAFVATHSLKGNLIGEQYARSLGVSLQKMKIQVLIATAILTGVTTAFLGPIAFIGIVIPHFSRIILKSTNLYMQFIFNILIGVVGMIFISLVNDFTNIPINILTSFIGIPVILYIMLKK